MANKTAPPAAARPTALHDVPDKILRLILQLLVASPLCVVRAAATCKRWRRLVADAKLVDSPSCRGPCPFAGSYRNDSLRGVVFAPSSSPDVVDGRHFSVDFLPGGSGSWELVDSRHGVLLLAKKNTWSSRRRRRGRRRFPDLLVCEPIKRRYQLIPPMEQMKHHPELAEATRRLTGYKEEYFCGGGALGIVAVDVRSVVLAPVLAPAPAKKKTWSFSIDLDTMEVAQCEDKTKNHAGVDVVEYPCELPWPPDLRACKARCARYERGRCARICVCH